MSDNKRPVSPHGTPTLVRRNLTGIGSVFERPSHAPASAPAPAPAPAPAQDSGKSND